MLERLTHEDFGACLNQTFRIYYTETEAIETELIQVQAWGSPYRDEAASGRQPFSLVFRGRQQGYLPQRIYRVENERLGRIEIFLVPLGPDQAGMRYEAVFT